MLRSRKIAMALLACVVLAVGAWTFATTVTVRVLGPFYTTPFPFDSALGNQVGGHVQYYLASDSCRIGQFVTFKGGTGRQVAPSVTLADWNGVAGVVVGGTRTGMQASVALADTGLLAATANQKVIVMTEGRYWVLDSGAVGAGVSIVPSLGGTLQAAGRAKIKPAAIDSFYRAVGRAIDTILIGKAGLVQINVR